MLMIEDAKGLNV
ncbi:unnamed protein product, partial [Allacma fusca]